MRDLIPAALQAEVLYAGVMKEHGCGSLWNWVKLRDVLKWACQTFNQAWADVARGQAEGSAYHTAKSRQSMAASIGVD